MKKILLLITAIALLMSCEKVTTQEEGTVMPANSGIITAPVSESDVQRTLGTLVNTWYELCNHPNINKWARFKPIYHTEHTVLTEADFVNSNFGLFVQVYSSASDLMSAFKEDRVAWEYIPRIISRITDFDKYSSSETAPAKGVPFGIYTLRPSDGMISIPFGDIRADKTNDYNIGLGEFTIGFPTGEAKLKDCYIGILLINKSDPSKYTFRSVRTLKDYSESTDSYDTLYDAFSLSGSTIACVYLSNNKVVSPSEIPANTYFVSAGVSPTTITIMVSGGNIQIISTAQWASDTNNLVRYSIRFVNYTSSAYTFQDAGIFFGTSMSVGTEPMLISGAVPDVSLGNKTVAGFSEVEVSGSFYKTRLTNLYHWMGVSYWSGSSQIVKWVRIDDPIS